MIEELKCPSCGTPAIEMCLCSNPPQYEMRCFSCGFDVRYFQRKDCFKHCTQDELNEGLKTPRMGDIVKHLPTGEEWIVCGINYKLGELIPCGYPFPSIAKISDCELVERIPLTMEKYFEYRKALEKEGYASFMC